VCQPVQRVLVFSLVVFDKGFRHWFLHSIRQTSVCRRLIVACSGDR
jgi:hypothetical protein